MDRKEQIDVLSRVLDDAKIERNPFTDYVQKIPYNIHRSKLYSTQELFDVFDKERDESLHDCLDTVVYRHVVQTGKTTNIPFEIVARDFHDLGMRIAMESFLEQYEQRQVVGDQASEMPPTTGGELDLYKTPSSEKVKGELRIIEIDFLEKIE